MTSISFSIGSGVTIRLTAVIDANGLPGIQVDVFTSGKDITAVFFDLVDDADLSGYTIAPPGFE